MNQQNQTSCEEKSAPTCVACRYGTPHHEEHCLVYRFSPLADQLIEENPYTDYSYVAQNGAVEKERAERYARSVARWLLGRLATEVRL